MNTKKRVAGVAAAITAWVGISMAAHAADPLWYGGLHGGINDLSGWDANVRFGPGISLPGHLTLDPGSNFGVIGGRQTENARFELEYQAGRFDITAIQLGLSQQNVSSSGRYEALTLNAYRTHEFSERITGYAGLGIGWGRVRLPQLGFTAGCNCFAAASGNGGVWLARIGAEYKVGDSDGAFVQYTSLRLPKSDSGGTPGTSYGRKSTGIASIGWRHVFR